MRRQGQLGAAPERTPTQPTGGRRAAAAAGAGTSLYVCAACDQQWAYPAVRHTGRCPTCGGGLLRAGDTPDA
jgi:DNA-directed RNA polymerase subunit RPC12/RpoP